MESWNSRVDLNTLDEIIDLLAAPRWAWRAPRAEEEESDADGKCAIAVRDECRRSACLKWVYEGRTGYLWMLWAEQRRDTPRSEWAAVDHFPRLLVIKENPLPYGKGTGCGRYRIVDMCITERNNEWKYLAPAELHSMMRAARSDVTESMSGW